VIADSMRIRNSAMRPGRDPHQSVARYSAEPEQASADDGMSLIRATDALNDAANSALRRPRYGHGEGIRFAYAAGVERSSRSSRLQSSYAASSTGNRPGVTSVNARISPRRPSATATSEPRAVLESALRRTPSRLRPSSFNITTGSHLSQPRELGCGFGIRGASLIVCNARNCSTARSPVNSSGASGSRSVFVVRILSSCRLELFLISASNYPVPSRKRKKHALSDSADLLSWMAQALPTGGIRQSKRRSSPTVTRARVRSCTTGGP